MGTEDEDEVGDTLSEEGWCSCLGCLTDFFFSNSWNRFMSLDLNAWTRAMFSFCNRSLLMWCAPGLGGEEGGVVDLARPGEDTSSLLFFLCTAAFIELSDRRRLKLLILRTPNNQNQSDSRFALSGLQSLQQGRGWAVSL